MNIAKQSWDIVEKIITNIYFPCGKYLLLPFEILLQLYVLLLKSFSQ